MDKMLKMCLNWRVIGALIVVGLGLWFVAPNLLAAAFPLLIIAVCPLSMVFMMKGMQGEKGKARPERANGSRASGDPERLQDLEVRLQETRGQQETIAREIARLKAPDDDRSVQAP